METAKKPTISAAKSLFMVKSFFVELIFRFSQHCGLP